MGEVRSAKKAMISIRKGFITRSGDNHLLSVRGKSNQSVVFIDSSGRCYTLKPAVSIKNKGDHLTKSDEV